MTCYGSLKKLIFTILPTTAPYSCAKSPNDVIENLQSNLRIPLKWFKDNQMMANPGKFQFMILSKNTLNKLIVINNKTIESSKSVKLLGLT